MPLSDMGSARHRVPVRWPDAQEVVILNAVPDIEYRRATSEDSAAVAYYLNVAGDGLYEFLLGDVIPGFSAMEILKWTVGVMSTPLSYENCYLAVAPDDREVAGLINLFPADRLHDQGGELISTERWRYLEPVFGLQDWGSLFINSLAVGEKWQRCGIGGRLLDYAYEQAKQDGFDRVSLHVWTDNLNAIAFYKRRGFVTVDTVRLPDNPDFPGKTGSQLMCRKV